MYTFGDFTTRLPTFSDHGPPCVRTSSSRVRNVKKMCSPRMID